MGENVNTQPDELQVEVQEKPQDEWTLAGNYIRISDDSMQAFLYLMPKRDGRDYTKEELLERLKGEGVTCHYHESNIAAMAKKRVFGREVLVAQGVPITTGKDGYYDYKIEMEDYRKHPKIREDGSVDYQSMNLLQNVVEGQLLAVYYNAVQGKDGNDVRGNIIAAPKYKELPALKGKGIGQDTDADGNTIYKALCEGKIIFRDSNLEICNVHEVKGDVDALIGRLEFFGDLVINGNVAAGVVIKAGKSLTISGTVEGADIYAGGDIILRRGVQGNEKGLIRAKGSVYADFIEHCRVEAKGNLLANYILNSDISVEGTVTATGKRGMLLGGNIHGFQGIKAVIVGNDKEVKTVLHAGCEQDVYDRSAESRKEEKQIMERLEELEERAEGLKKQLIVRSKDENLLHECERLIQERDTLTERAKQLEGERQMLQDRMEEGRQSSIRVEGKIYAGTLITVNNARMPILENTSFMQYKSISGIIQGTVIRI